MILHQLKIQKNLIPLHTRQQLISSLIFPHFDYCCLVYHDITEVLNVKLESLLNMCVRFIFNLKKDDHISPYFTRLTWLKAKTRRKYFLGSYIYSLFQNQQPGYLKQCFPPRVNMANVTTRVPPDFLIPPLHRTTTYQKSFCVAGAKLWNSVPIYLKNLALYLFTKKDFF